MILLSRFILKGTSQAALVAASMAMLSLVPLVGWFTILISGAAVALVTLVQGYRHGMLVMLVALVGSAVFSGLLFAQPLVALYFLLAVWLPVWLVAMVLRETVSLSLSVLVITAMSLLALLMMYLVFPGFEEYWRQPLNSLVVKIANESSQLSEKELHSAVAVIIRLIPGLIASTLLFATTLSLMLARWWQAVNFNPGGFATEFQTLNLGKSAALAALLILAVTWWLQSDLMFAMSLVVLTLYTLQGASVMHGVVAKRRMNQVWTYLVYLLMLFVPQIMVALVLIGLADTWIDFRRRFAAEFEKP
jgi:hypothetical protein